MRAVLFHCRNYFVKLGKLANRPKDVKPEDVKYKEQARKDCVVALITVEDKDNPEDVALKLSKELMIMAHDVGRDTIVLLPFAHLSNNLADSIKAVKTLDLIETELKNFKVLRGHFGSHKELLLDIYGHQGNARYREF